MRHQPLELTAGLSVFAAAAAGGAVRHVASSSLVILLILSLVCVRSWPRLWRQLSSDERLFLFCLCLYFLTAILSYYNVSDQHEYIKHLGKYARFILIVPVYIFVSRADLKLFPYLLAGAIVSGPLYLGVAFLSIADNPAANAKGYYHHITFGSMAMLGAVFLTTVLAVKKTSVIMKSVLVISIVCLLYSSILSQARGAWLALPFCLFLLLSMAVRHGKIEVKTIFIALLVLGTALAVTPAKEIITSRVQRAAHEVELFQSKAVHYSPVGSRLAMWEIAVDVWKEYPYIGTGPGDFDLEIQASKKDNGYIKLYEHSSVHNIYFQSLATTGAIGFVILCWALFYAPFRILYKANKGGVNVAGLSGMVVLTAFAVFGLTESWTLRAPLLTVYLIYLATLATAASRDMAVERSDV